MMVGGALVLATLLVADMVLDSVVTRGISKVGARLTGTGLTLDGADLFLFSGSGAIKNLSVPNPVGYSALAAFQIGKINVGLKPESVFQDTLQISHIRVVSPQINFEGTLNTNNLADILKNVEAILGGSNRLCDPPELSGKRMHVDDLWITGARLNVAAASLGAPPQILSLPDIHFISLGAGTNGISGAELAQMVLSRLNQEAIEALAWGIATSVPGDPAGEAPMSPRDNPEPPAQP